MASKYDEKQVKRATRNKLGGDQTTWIQRLPQVIALDILSRLPITSLQNCKYVSRAWNSLAKDPALADMHLSRAAEHSICLIVYNFPRCKLGVVHVEESDCYTKTPKELTIPFQHLLPCFDIVSSCNGLICLSNLLDGDPIYIYNPIGRHFRELPRVTTRSDLSVFSVVFGFGFHPGTKAYKVVVMVYYTKPNNFYSGVSREPEAYVLTLGTSAAWRHIGKVPYQLLGPTSEALVNGRLHWLTRRHENEGFVQRQEIFVYDIYRKEFQECAENGYRDIISFDIAREEFQEIPKPSCGGLNRSNYHLVELGGCLSAVVSNCEYTKNEIWMMKNYNVKESWIKEFVIADYVPRGLSMLVDMPANTRYVIQFTPATSSRSGTKKRDFRVLCALKNGEVLLAYKCRFLVSYNPETKEFKDLEFEGLPVDFETTLHLGSLVSIDAAFKN